MRPWFLTHRDTDEAWRQQWSSLFLAVTWARTRPRGGTGTKHCACVDGIVLTSQLNHKCMERCKDGVHRHLKALQRISQAEWDELSKSRCKKLGETYTRRLEAAVAIRRAANEAEHRTRSFQYWCASSDLYNMLLHELRMYSKHCQDNM